VFKWICLSCALIGSATALWMINDIRLRSHESMENLEVITENLAEVVTDVNALKNLSGLSSTKDEGRLAYATSVLEYLDDELSDEGVEVDSAGLIGRRKPFEDWLTGAGMESLGLVMGKAKSQKDVFWGLCQTFPGNNDFLLYFPGKDEGVKLSDWLLENHAESKALFADKVVGDNL